MQRREFLVSSALGSVGVGTGHVALSGGSPFIADLMSESPSAPGAATRKILIAGGNYGTPFIRYMAALTFGNVPITRAMFKELGVNVELVPAAG